MTTAPHAIRERWVSLALIVLTLLVYVPVCSHDFINLDDQTYVFENPHVRTGFTPENVRWAFVGAHASNWHPVTWLSHMLDCELFGLNPGLHHLVNLLFHVANALLLFRVLTIMTRAMWPSAFVAALFALHPLHVESVAWIAERKDVLSTFFGMLTLWAYARFVERRAKSRYLIALLFLVLGLMSKPMLVTLPFVLLLLDIWPLNRTAVAEKQTSPTSFARLLIEKLPFLVCSLAACAITVWAQHGGGAIVPVATIPMADRMGNALLSYVQYIGQMLLPTDLAIYYPQTNPHPVWQVTLAGLFLFCVTLLVSRQLKRRPWLGVGWFWYLGTLVPVIGFVQIGGQSMADRYTYVPLIGLFVMIAWGAQEWVDRQKMSRQAAAIAAGVILLACMAGTRLQLQHWQNSITLFEHTLRVTRNNSLAHFNLGCALSAEGRHDEAITHYLEALRIEPTYAKAQFNLETTLSELTAAADATQTPEATRSRLQLAYAHNQFAILLAHSGNRTKAIPHFSESVRLDPNNAAGRLNLGLALLAENRNAEAIAQFREALRIQPGLTEARANLDEALQRERTGSE